MRVTAAIAAVTVALGSLACATSGEDRGPSFCPSYSRVRTALDGVFEREGALRLEAVERRLGDLTDAAEQHGGAVAADVAEAGGHWEEFVELARDPEADATARRDAFGHVREALEPIDQRCDT